jgi:Transposase DNA-binding/Transposase Tn5 dimerisation domain
MVEWRLRRSTTEGLAMLPTVSTHQTPPGFWAHQQFQGARLGHCARTKRLVAYAQALAEQPGKAIPELLPSKYDIEATYDLFKRPEATPDAIQAGHRRLVRAAMRTSGRYLLFEDTTYVSFSHRRAVEGLGPIGKAEEGQQGFLLHSILVARAPELSLPDATGRRPGLEIVGLADQQSLIRVPRPKGEPRKASTQRLYRERESRRWIDSGQRLGRAPGDESIRWVRVADREADIYEYLISCQDLGHGFLVRMSQDRVALDPCDGRRLGTVFEHAAAAEPAGGLYLDLRARPGMAARRARLLISFGSVRVRAPWRPGKSVATAKPVDCWFVRVWEPEPPPGIEPLEWDLYADQPIESLEDALGVAMDYGSRFLIEEFHKGLKTGLNAESLQLETSHRLIAAIAVMSVVALRLLDLKELGRRLPEAAASASGLDAEEREILGIAVGRELTTVADILLALGRLGGHMNRRSDGMPGWITLWRGMTKLRLLIEGARLAREIASKKPHT